MKATVTIEGRDFGTIEVPPATAEGREVCGIAYFCEYCCRVWATIRIDGRRTFAEHIPCRQHHRYTEWPGGSIWCSWLPHFTRNFNEEIIREEFTRHLELYEEAQGAPPASDVSL